MDFCRRVIAGQTLGCAFLRGRAGELVVSVDMLRTREMRKARLWEKVLPHLLLRLSCLKAESAAEAADFAAATPATPLAAAAPVTTRRPTMV